MDKISVIVPFFNRVEWAIQAVQSVIDQTYDHWELILVDDGSTSDLAPLVALASSDARISIYHQENAGPATARNYGLQLATGSYVAFLDSDDLFVAGKLETQLNYMKSTNCSVSHTSYARMTVDGQPLDTIRSGTMSGNVFPRILSACPVATPTVMARTSVFSDKKFPDSFQIGEDVCLWIQLASEYEFGGIDTPLTRVRYLETSAASNDLKQAEGLINICSFLIRDPALSQYPSHTRTLLQMAAETLAPPSERATRQKRRRSIWKKMWKYLKAA